MKSIASAAVIFSSVIGVVPAAQAPAQPTFEVASVKPTNSNVALIELFPGGRLRATNFPLQTLISRAWQLQKEQIDGGPSWIRLDGYDIEAKAEGNPLSDQMWLMLRALLTDRFKLSLRSEMRPLPVYELKMARRDRRLGPDLRPFSEANCASASPSSGTTVAPFDFKHPPCGVLYSPTGHWMGRG